MITIPIAIFLFGYVFKVSLVDRLLKPGGDDIPLVIATIGLGLFLREYVRTAWQATPANFPSAFGNEVWRPGGVAITANDVGVLVVSVDRHRRDCRLFLNRTYTGRQMEAAAQNAETADGARRPRQADGAVHVRVSMRCCARSQRCS